MPLNFCTSARNRGDNDNNVDLTYGLLTAGAANDLGYWQRERNVHWGTCTLLAGQLKNLLILMQRKRGEMKSLQIHFWNMKLQAVWMRACNTVADDG